MIFIIFIFLHFMVFLLSSVIKLHNFLLLNNEFAQLFHLLHIFLMYTGPHGFLFSFLKYLSTKQVPDPVLSTGGTTVNNKNRIMNLTAW